VAEVEAESISVLGRRIRDSETLQKLPVQKRRPLNDAGFSATKHGGNDEDIEWLARSAMLDGIALPAPYVDACRFLGCGIIDRSYKLDQGFDYAVLDPIPPGNDNTMTFIELCDTMAREIVAEAIETQKTINVLWSGGIDSTAALIAIMQVVEPDDRRALVEVLVSIESIQEYPSFYQNHIKGKYHVKPVADPITKYVDPSAIVVTGEHGDQLFGSHLLRRYVEGGSAHLPYWDVLPFVLTENLGSAKKADDVLRYLEPQVAAAPVTIRTLFDCLWWLNFSLKWQQVTLRLAVFKNEEVRETFGSMRHFFRDRRFQSWSLSNPSARSTATWERYKDAAKQYIFSFTGDMEYYLTKTKELSLKRVFVKSELRKKYQCHVFMRDNYRPVFKYMDRKTKAMYDGPGIPL
jgi:hypothetical protein